MSDPANRTLPEDEFDVETFARKIYSVWKAVLRKLIFPLVLLFHKPLRLLVFTAVAFAVALGLKYAISPVYESQLYFVPANKGDLIFLNLIHDLQELAENNDEEALAGLMALSAEDAKVIKSIKASPIWRNKTQGKDTVSLVEVTVRASQLQVFPRVQKSLMQYIESSEHYARIRALRLQEIKALQSKLEQEMAAIDSLKGMLVRDMFPRNAGGFVYGEPLDPVRVYDAAFSLYRQKISLVWQENYVNNFELLKPFVVSSKPVWPKLSYLLCASLALAFVVLLAVNYRDRSRLVFPAK